MASQLGFNNRVAIITGAGGALGRQYSLLLASRGCTIVVNDLDAKNAQKTVDEIKIRGGKAIACIKSVEDGQEVVKTAIDEFGRVDILINNAGMLRDKSLLKMTDSDWDMIHKVHLRGAFILTRAAWPYMREQKYGKVIVTASSAGLYGNFGQTNYSAAKMGLVGFSNSLAVEGQKYNINSNVIIPIAGSQLTENIIPKELFEKLQPDYVAPVVAWLCHEKCKETGGIFEAAGGWVARYQISRSRGKVFKKKEDLTPEALDRDWSTITDMKGGAHFYSVGEHFATVISDIQNLPQSKL